MEHYIVNGWLAEIIDKYRFLYFFFKIDSFPK